MTWTWEQVISLALVRSGRVGEGQAIAPRDFATGKALLNLLLDEWDGEGLALPNIDTQITFNTVPNQAKYELGPGGDNSVRPEQVLTGTCTIQQTPQVTRVIMAPMTMEDYTRLFVPSNISQPWNFAVNETFPKMEVYLYPTPDKIYPIIFNCKVKWYVTAGDVNANAFSTAQIPSGYANALVDNLALKIAKRLRLETDTLINDANAGRFMIAAAVATQIPDRRNSIPMGIFGNTVILAGRNP
jgi:hypothetical protein